VRGGINPHDLIQVALHLANASGKKPKQAHLLRAISTAYYAMFHALARCCADTMIGGPSATRSKPAWRQVYRSLDHGPAKNAWVACSKIGDFPVEIQDFANLFRTMQEKRHKADYDPLEKAYKSEVLVDIDQVQASIERFGLAPLKDRRAFAALVLFKPARP
jgi:uncharacterized protein (UPF0332 family)